MSENVSDESELYDNDPLNLAIWGGKRVSVWDYTLAPWRPHVAAMVDHFNALGVSRLPRLEYVPMREAGYEVLSRKDLARRGILIAVAPSDRVQGVGHVSYELARAGRFLRCHLLLSDAHPPDRAPLCHEFMHALTMMDDRPERPLPQSSCIWGYLRAPGEFDRQYLRTIYRQLRDE